jgi:hypothetical protein
MTNRVAGSDFRCGWRLRGDRLGARRSALDAAPGIWRREHGASAEACDESMHAAERSRDSVVPGAVAPARGERSGHGVTTWRARGSPPPARGERSESSIRGTTPRSKRSHGWTAGADEVRRSGHGRCRRPRGGSCRR